MSQERTTSLRILQTNKKKNLSPVVYLLIGFFSGVIFTALLLFVFSSVQSSEYVEPTQVVEQPTAIAAEAKPNVQVQATADTAPAQHEMTATQDDTAAVQDDTDIAQPGSNELNKFFQRAPATPPKQTGQQISPFANEPNAKAAPTAAPAKLMPAKKEAIATATQAPKPAIQPVKATTAKEPEAVTPDATVKINVTRKPFAVNELQ